MGAADKQLSLLCSEAPFSTAGSRGRNVNVWPTEEPHAASQAVPQHRSPRGSPSGSSPDVLLVTASVSRGGCDRGASIPRVSGARLQGPSGGDVGVTPQVTQVEGA